MKEGEEMHCNPEKGKESCSSHKMRNLVFPEKNHISKGRLETTLKFNSKVDYSQGQKQPRISGNVRFKQGHSR